MTNRDNASAFQELRRREPGLTDQQIVQRLCEQLLVEAEVEPPVPVERIASLRGVVALEKREQPWAGMLFRRRDGFVISVRENDSYERQRFTICHEAGHTLLPGYRQTTQFRCDGGKTRVEQLADIAASELLLPRRFFAADLRSRGLRLQAVENLADEYQASIEATALRTVDVWTEPALLLSLRVSHKPAERGREGSVPAQLRLQYAHAQGHWPFLRRHKSVDANSPFARALDGELIHEIGSLGELAAEDVGPVEIDARRYGRDERVLALIRPARADRSH